MRLRDRIAAWFQNYITWEFLRWTFFGFLLLVLFFFEIFFGVKTLSAHQLHHNVRDIEINGTSGVILSQIKEFREDFRDIEVDYQARMDEIKLEAAAIDKFESTYEENRTELNQLLAERENQMSVRVSYQELLELTSLDEDLRVEFENQLKNAKIWITTNDSMILEMDKILVRNDDRLFSQKCELIRKVIAADNLQVIKKSRLLSDFGFGVRSLGSETNATFASTIAYGNYFNYFEDIEYENKKINELNTATEKALNNRDQQYLTAAKKTEREPCELKEIQRGKDQLVVSRQLQNALSDVRYFTKDTETEVPKDFTEETKRKDLSPNQAEINTSGKTSQSPSKDQSEDNKSSTKESDDDSDKPGFFRAKWSAITGLIKIPPLITWPQQLLTICVVMIMGALGATITVTRTYLDKDVKPWLPAYIFMPLLGSVTGFVIFVLAKAGFLIISDGGSNGSGAFLSPYFISFLGLVSGMLVIDALDTITKIGRTWFSTSSDGVKRWATGLEVIAENKTEVDDIAKKLGELDYKVKAWLQGIESVPPRTQSDLALILDKDIRNIFTDIPPK